MKMAERTANVYQYDTSYETMCNVSIIIGASTYTDINKGRYFIIVINEALYYGKKLNFDHTGLWFGISPLIKT